MKRTLIRNGTVVSVDPAIGDLPAGDLLIEGDRIAAIGRGLAAGDDAEVIDATGMIVMPGLVNAHLHTWQTALRGLGGDWAGADYFNILHSRLAPRYTPEDTRIATLAGCLGQLDAGTTTLFDWCHNNRTPDHTDAAVEALQEAGIRAVFGHGTVKPPPRPGEPHFSTVPHPVSEILRLRRGRFASDDALLTLAMAILGPDYATCEVNLHDFRFAREQGLLTSAHAWGRENRLVPEGYLRLIRDGLIGPDHNVTHGNYLPDDELRALVDHGASLTSAPPAEIRTHAREPVIGRVLAAGGLPSIAPDSEVVTAGDMFGVMRAAIGIQRFVDNRTLEERIRRDAEGPEARYARENLKSVGTGGAVGEKVSVTARQALVWATLGNARALRLDGRVGSLAPGKQADIVLLRTTDLNLTPVNDPVGSIIFHAGPGNVDTVWVAGEIVKKNGRLIRFDARWPRIRERLLASRRRILGGDGPG